MILLYFIIKLGLQGLLLWTEWRPEQNLRLISHFNRSRDAFKTSDLKKNVKTGKVKDDKKEKSKRCLTGICSIMSGEL